MRGGTSYISKKYSEANNKYCPNYDKNKPKVYVNYLDMNNLYGYAISEYLPYGGFKWIEVNNETVTRILNKSHKQFTWVFFGSKFGLSRTIP